MKPIPVIDLFAGPGGLGEGFSRYQSGNGFKIRLSIEMDEYAHRTLELRAFVREFGSAGPPSGYYEYMAGRITRDALFQLHPVEAQWAREEAWHTELGGRNTSDREVDLRIATALGGKVQGKWVLIGGPPCQAYSLVGRSRVIGGEGLKKYEADPRHQLYRHYLRILAVHSPPVFVMENVKGLLSARVGKEQTIERILSDLGCPSDSMPGLKEAKPVHYELHPLSVASAGQDIIRPEDFIVRAEHHGIPQARHRVIILGVRSDLKRKPRRLSRGRMVTVDEAIGDLPPLRSALSKKPDSSDAWRAAIERMTGAAWFQNHDLFGGLTDAVDHLLVNGVRGGAYVQRLVKPAVHASWYCDRRMKGVCNHESRGHIEQDLHRYLFAAVFAKANGRSPLLEEFPRALLPCHANVKAALKKTKFNDRFRVQIAGRPSTTVVSHIAKDGHYYIHYDPKQCRSLTVREAARLQTFPDNYFFEGPRTEQYKQVGNAVPPLLARQIAAIVANILK